MQHWRLSDLNIVRYNRTVLGCARLLADRQRSVFKVIFAGLISLIFNVYLVAAPTRVLAQATCAPGQIDMVEYKLPLTAGKYSLNVCSVDYPLDEDGNPSAQQNLEMYQLTPEERSRVEQAFNLTIPGDTVVEQRKGNSFELYSYDSQKIYFLMDTSWDVKCEGEPAALAGKSSYYLVYSDTGLNAWGGKIPRCLNPGEKVNSTQEVRAFYRPQTFSSVVGLADYYLSGADAGNRSIPEQCDSRYSTRPGQPAQAGYVADFTDPGSNPAAPKGTGSTIKIYAPSGISAGETQYYSGGFGLTAFTIEQGSRYVFHSAYANPDGESTKLLCSSKARSQLDEARGTDPIYIFPKLADADSYGGFKTMWEKYLANTQVYCAPGHIYWPKLAGGAPLGAANSESYLNPCQEVKVEDGDPLGQGGIYLDGTCTETEYPVVDVESKFDLSTTILPLFRTDRGEISVEADLARVSPGDSLSNAIAQMRNADYAPQFYMSSPQLQCLHVASYVEYVEKLCQTYDAGNPNCSARKDLKKDDQVLVSWETIVGTVTKDRCATYQGNPRTDSDVYEIITTLSPQTPKVFKLGFLVNHEFLFDKDKPLINLYMKNVLAMWFKGEPAKDLADFLNERITLVPVWYMAGVTSNQFTKDQVAPIGIDPDDYPPGTELNLEQFPDNFLGPLWKTYAAALPLHTQEKIAEEKVDTVRETYNVQQFFYDKTTHGPFQFTYKGEGYESESIIACTDYKCLPQVTDPEYQERMSELYKSFPEGVLPDNEISSLSYITDLYRVIVARINSGVQRTWFASETGTPYTPISARNFHGCSQDTDNTGYGYSESAQSIGSLLLQQLNQEAKQYDGMKGFTYRLLAKVLYSTEAHPAGQPQTSTSYLILPDEAIDIDIAQTYFSPMFLSPEMYQSIIMGENEIYQFKDDPSAGNGLSAFLRTEGYKREVNADVDGYAFQKTIHYGSKCQIAGFTELDVLSGISIPRIECDCDFSDVKYTQTSSSINVVNPGTQMGKWKPIAEIAEQEATLENGCVEISASKGDQQTVTVWGHREDTEQNEELEVPGQTMALHEYLRRMAFLPHYLIQKYEGLEQFYGGGGATIWEKANESIAEKSKNLSEFFRALFNNISATYDQDFPLKSCNFLYVDRATAEKNASVLREIWSYDEIRSYMDNGKNLPLYNSCGGDESCMDFILDTILSTPVCDGSLYLNPYVVFQISRIEASGLREEGYNFGCNMDALTKYKDGTYQGFQCTVETALGNRVINPLIVALEGQEFSYAAGEACVDPSATRDHAYTRRTSPEDGLACMFSVLQNMCLNSSDDVDALQQNGDEGYGYTGDPLYIVGSNMYDLATQIKRTYATGGSIRPQRTIELEQILRDNAAMLWSKDSCSGSFEWK